VKNDIRYETSDPKTTNKTETLFSCEKEKGVKAKKLKKRETVFSLNSLSLISICAEHKKRSRVGKAGPARHKTSGHHNSEASVKRKECWHNTYYKKT